MQSARRKGDLEAGAGRCDVQRDVAARGAGQAAGQGQAQARAVVWCAERAGMRIHGTTAQRPAEMFTELEASCLLPVPEPYDVPVFTKVRFKFMYTRAEERHAGTKHVAALDSLEKLCTR